MQGIVIENSKYKNSTCAKVVCQILNWSLKFPISLASLIAWILKLHVELKNAILKFDPLIRKCLFMYLSSSLQVHGQIMITNLGLLIGYISNQCYQLCLPISISKQKCTYVFDV